MCHAANAFFSSNFDKSLIHAIDGGGLEDKNILTAVLLWEKEKKKKIKVYDYYKFNTQNRFCCTNFPFCRWLSKKVIKGDCNTWLL